MKAFQITTSISEAKGIEEILKEGPYLSLTLDSLEYGSGFANLYLKPTTGYSEINPLDVFKAGVLAERVSKEKFGFPETPGSEPLELVSEEPVYAKALLVVIFILVMGLTFSTCEQHKQIKKLRNILIELKK